MTAEADAANMARAARAAGAAGRAAGMAVGAKLTVIPAPPVLTIDDVRQVVREELALARGEQVQTWEVEIKSAADRLPEGSAPELQVTLAEIRDDLARYRAARFLQHRDGHHQHCDHRVAVTKVAIGLLEFVLKPFRHRPAGWCLGVGEPGQALPNLVAGVSHDSPSLVADTASVGDGPVTGGDPAGPGHPSGGAR